jgi:hypothetical protein
MSPNSVCWAVATTRPRAEPWVTRVPMKTVLWRSVMGVVWACGGMSRVSVFFVTGSFSPVRDDSSTSKSTLYAKYKYTLKTTICK